jgi:hypothetical protein
MIIKVERSGGVAGIPFYKEVDTSKLPSSLLIKLKKLVDSPNPLRSTKSAPKGAGDYYIYKISIPYGSSQRSIECTQYDINEDIKALFRYVERNSRKL